MSFSSWVYGDDMGYSIRNSSFETFCKLRITYFSEAARYSSLILSIRDFYLCDCCCCYCSIFLSIITSCSAFFSRDCMLSVFDIVALIRVISCVSSYVTSLSVLLSAASPSILYRNLFGLFSVFYKIGYYSSSASSSCSLSAISDIFLSSGSKFIT